MSYKRLIADILNAHADQLLAQSNTSKNYVTLLPDQIELHKLLHLATHIHQTLKPIQPSEKFRQQLYQDLMAEAHLNLVKAQQTSPSTFHALRSPKIPILLTMVVTLLVGFYWRGDR